MKTQISSTNISISQLEKEKNQLNSQIDSLNSQLVQAQTKNKSLEKENSQLKDQIQKLKLDFAAPNKGKSISQQSDILALIESIQKRDLFIL